MNAIKQHLIIYWGVTTEAQILAKLNDPAKVYFNITLFFVSKINSIGIDN